MSAFYNYSANSLAALILAYRRQDNILTILESLRKGGIQRIYLSVDGPKISDVNLVAESIIELVEEYCKKHSLRLFTLRRTSNLGLGLAVLTALDWFFSKEELGIVIEDDLIFEADFVRFCQEALDYFEHDPEVWIVSGNRYDNYIVDESNVSWATYPMIWGWATWSSRWPEIRNAITSTTIEKENFSRIAVREYWKTGLRRVNTGILNSWAVPLAAQMKSQVKYCVLPPSNLVSNIGIDSNAEHTTLNVWHSGREIRNLPTNIVFSSYQRKEIALKTDLLFENLIFNIRNFHCLSYIVSIIFDSFRFRNVTRLKSLSSRFEKFSQQNSSSQ